MVWASYAPASSGAEGSAPSSPLSARLLMTMGGSAGERLLPGTCDASGAGGTRSPGGARAWLPTCATLQLLLCGQIVSLLTCGTGVFSQYLSDRMVQIPTSQNFLNYVLLAAVYMPWLAYGTGGLVAAFRARWWKYLLIALVDVEANFVIVLAYRYTTITSVQLLDCATIPIVMLLSFVILSTSYRFTHILGALTCLAGLGFVVFADFSVQKVDTGGAADMSLGDGLAFVGAALYAVSNVAEEYAVKNHSTTEFLAFVGVFGAIISGVQMAALERHALVNTEWSAGNVGLLLGYCVCLFLMYSLVPILIGMSSATVMNLSLLTSDVYSLFFGLFLFQLKFSPLYLAGFSIVLIGLLGYMWYPEGCKEDTSTGAGAGAVCGEYHGVNSADPLDA